MNKKRAVTQNLGKQELLFMCTALPLDEIYPPTKFHNHSFYSLGDMHQTKFKYKKKTKSNNSKTKQARVTVHVHCTPTLMRSIHPQNFITIAIIVLEICTRQKSSLKVNKGQSLKKKKKKANKSYGSCALHSPLIRSIHPQNFITIVSTVLEICSGQNSSMKINEGQ